MPTLIRNAVPASRRPSAETSHFAQGLMARTAKPDLLAGAEARALTLATNRFAPMPQEPEDARMTGVTRSLNRRLLALNVPGSLMRGRSGSRVA